MKKLSISLSLVLVLFLTACGYKVHGLSDMPVQTAIGNGTATLRVDSVEQSTLYPWLPHYVTSVIRDEIVLRKLAKWSNSLNSDYYLNAEVLSFDISAYDEDYFKSATLSSATVRLVINIFDSQTHETVWTSHEVTYSETYESTKADSSIREVLKEAIELAFDNLQNTF